MAGLIRSPVDTRDYPLSAGLPAGPLPATLDLRKSFKRVRNQGSTKMCTAYAGCSIKESHVSGLGRYLNPAFIYDLRIDKSVQGMYIRDLLSILLKTGVPPEDTQASEAGGYKIKSYYAVNTIDELKSALSLMGGCIIAFPSYNQGTTFWKPAGGGVATASGGHAVAVVGWTTEGFIIRNSWGLLWGKFGYTIYPFSDWGAHWEVWAVEDLPSVATVSGSKCC
jgi:hypothetical protein